MKKIKFSILEKNNSFKILTAKSTDSAIMKPHIADKDAFFMVQKGKILFTLNQKKHLLNLDDCISIPKNTLHSFEVIQDAAFLLILDATAKIQFVE